MSNEVYWAPAEYGKILQHPFHPEFLEALKDEVPEAEHEWRGSGRWISDAYIKEVEILINRFFAE